MIVLIENRQPIGSVKRLFEQFDANLPQDETDDQETGDEDDGDVDENDEERIPPSLNKRLRLDTPSTPVSPSLRRQKPVYTQRIVLDRLEHELGMQGLKNQHQRQQAEARCLAWLRVVDNLIAVKSITFF